MNLSIYLVPPLQVSQWVPGLKKYLEKSEAWTRGRAEAVDIVEFLLTGRMYLWVVVDDVMKPWGYVITEIKDYPKCKMLVIQYCAGEDNHMKYIEDEMYHALDNFAQDAGCAGIEFFGRPGWGRYAKKYGYEVKTVVFEKYFEVQP